MSVTTGRRLNDHLSVEEVEKARTIVMGVGIAVCGLIIILTTVVAIYFCKMRRAIQIIDLKKFRNARASVRKVIVVEPNEKKDLKAMKGSSEPV